MFVKEEKNEKYRSMRKNQIGQVLSSFWSHIFFNSFQIVQLNRLFRDIH